MKELILTPWEARALAPEPMEEFSNFQQLMEVRLCELQPGLLLTMVQIGESCIIWQPGGVVDVAGGLAPSDVGVEGDALLMWLRQEDLGYVLYVYSVEDSDWEWAQSALRQQVLTESGDAIAALLGGMFSVVVPDDHAAAGVR